MGKVSGMVEGVWLVAVLAGLALWTVRGNRQYAEFKRLADSRRRAACYLRWTAESFLLLTGASLITLWILGRPEAPFSMPEAFGPLAANFTREAPIDSADGMLGFAIGAAMGLGLLAFLYHRRLRHVVDAVAGDIEPMLPRNLRERIAVVPLCLNAGFSEELFFRLALPLLAAEVTGSAAFGFALAVLAFGLAHAYQGWKGIVATTLLGALFAIQYLAGIALLWLMAVHALIDLLGLIVRPMLADRFASRRPAAAA